MRIPVQKAITNPLKIIGAPYGLAMANFIVFFMLFIVSLVMFEGDINPLYFLAPFMSAHYIIARLSKDEPQLGRIILSRLRLVGLKIPSNLVS